MSPFTGPPPANEGPSMRDDRTPPHDHIPSLGPPAGSPEEERVLNAAAAREISRELDALHFGPPSPVALTNIPGRSREPSPYADRQYPGHTPSSAPQDQPWPSPSVEHPPYHQPQVPYPGLNTSSPYANQSSSSPTGPRSPITPPSPRHSLPLPVLPPIGISVPIIPPSSSPPSSANTYWAPQDFHRSTGPSLESPALNKSTASLTPSPTPGTRTIPAAAFRRPQARVATGPLSGGVGMADTTPLLSRKRTLPSSPYPQHRTVPSNESLGNQQPGDPRAQRSRSSSQQLRDPSSTTGEEDDQFDYIAAYVNAMGSAESGSSGHGAPTPATDPSRTAGYGEGRFATDLEGERLR